MRYEIWFESYQEGSMWSKEDFAPIKVEQIWDMYRDQMIMEEAGVSEGRIRKIHEGRRLLYDTQRVIPESSRGKILRSLPPVVIESADEFIMVIGGTFPDELEEAKRIYRTWLSKIVQRESQRGADDGTYDYYPDCWFVAKQLAEGLGMEGVYNQAVDDLRLTTDYGDEESDLFELIEKIDEVKE
jgi:hypothetical protein